MRRELSAGFIVMRDTRRGPVFLLLRATHGFWGFPKGGMEKGERAIDTAVRELKEETGIERFFVVSGFRTQYSYRHKERNKTARETVVLYIAKTDTAAVTLSPREHTAFRWLSYDGMMQTISFDNARRPFVRAHRFLARAKKNIALQEKVYAETRRIQKGKVVSYGAIAKRCATSPRTVARILANNYDPRVPCHRVVSSAGSVLGYNRGVAEKTRLLKKEGIRIAGNRIIDSSI